MGTAVQFTTLFLSKEVAHFNYLVATAIAVETAVIHNFVWHEQFTWADRTKLARTKLYRTRFDRTKVNRTKFNQAGGRCLRRFLRFNLSNGGVSILGNLVLMKLLFSQAHLNYLVANALAIALCSVANFLLSETWVFARAFVDCLRYSGASSHNYNVELPYQRRTRRARSVFQRLAPPTPVSISNGINSG
jgi:putative flippase GtrA